MDEHEIERIAAAINALRPDWPRSSLRTLITTKLAHKTRRDVCVALAWIACESNTSNPGRVIEAGPWWKAAAVGEPNHGGTRYPPKPEQECGLHIGEWADTCRTCHGPRAYDDEPGTVAMSQPPRPSARGYGSEHVREAREAVRRAKEETA